MGSLVCVWPSRKTRWWVFLHHRSCLLNLWAFLLRRAQKRLVSQRSASVHLLGSLECIFALQTYKKKTFYQLWTMYISYQLHIIAVWGVGLLYYSTVGTESFYEHVPRHSVPNRDTIEFLIFWTSTIFTVNTLSIQTKRFNYGVILSNITCNWKSSKKHWKPWLDCFSSSSLI